MAVWRTFVGFFQEIKKDGKLYCNFFPVMEKVNDRFQKVFPHPEFHYGRLELKKENTRYDNWSNIQFETLKKLKSGMNPNELVAVSINMEKCQEEENEGRYWALFIESGEELNDGIRFESFEYETIFGKKKVLLSTEELRGKTLRANKRTICLVDEGPCSDPFSCVFECDGLYSNAVVAKRTDQVVETEGKFWFYESDVSDVINTRDSVKTEDVVYRVDDTDFRYCADEMQNNYAATSKFTLVEIDDNAVRFPGKLAYSTTGKKYILEKDGDEIQPPDISGGRVTPPAPPVSELDFVTKTTQFLRDCGRDVNKADVINYCICITQGFITTFAGAPGTGKTTLCRLLAKAMGLREETGDYGNENARYAEISVERGWTSLKDFIGYPNPFPSVDNNEKKAKGTQNDAIIAFILFYLEGESHETNP